jgi:TfoX/Sxy family transcriptional regulator of competence genes
MSWDAALAERLRETVSELTGGDFHERRMFGGLAFLVGGHMAVAASREGGLLLRINPADTDRLLARPHAAPFHMRERPIDGWLRIDAEGVSTGAQMRDWVTHGIRWARSLPPRP